MKKSFLPNFEPRIMMCQCLLAGIAVHTFEHGFSVWFGLMWLPITGLILDFIDWINMKVGK